MPISDLDFITIQEVLECPKGTEVKTKGTITHSLQPKKLWKGISQFIVIKDRTESIGCNIGVSGLNDGYELGENVIVVGERSEYPEKDRRTGQPTGGVVKNINGRVEERFMDVDSDLEEETEETEDTEGTEKQTSVPVGEKTVSMPKYDQAMYWRDKFLLDVERQEMYKINNEYIVRECALKAVTEMFVARLASSDTPNMPDNEYYKIANEIVKWIKDENEDFEEDTEANMIISGLSPLKKTEIIDWINEKRLGTELEEEENFLINLNVQVLSHQTIKELRETVDIMMKYFKNKGE